MQSKTKQPSGQVCVLSSTPKEVSQRQFLCSLSRRSASPGGPSAFWSNCLFLLSWPPPGQETWIWPFKRLHLLHRQHQIQGLTFTNAHLTLSRMVLLPCGRSGSHGQAALWALPHPQAPHHPPQPLYSGEGTTHLEQFPVQMQKCKGGALLGFYSHS